MVDALLPGGMGVLYLGTRLLVDAECGRKPQAVVPHPHGSAGAGVDVDGDVPDPGIGVAVFVQGAGTGLQRPGIPAAAVPVTAAEGVLFRGEIPADGVGDDIGEDQVVVRRGVPHDVAFGTPEVTGIAPDGALAGDMFVAPGREAAEIAAVAFLLFEGFLLAPHFVADRNFGEGTGEGFAAERRSRIGRSRERRDGRRMFALGAEQRGRIGLLRKGCAGGCKPRCSEQYGAQNSHHRSAPALPDTAFSYQSKSTETDSASRSNAARASAVTCRMCDSPVDLTMYSTVLPLPIFIE